MPGGMYEVHRIILSRYAPLTSAEPSRAPARYPNDGVRVDTVWRVQDEAAFAAMSES